MRPGAIQASPDPDAVAREVLSARKYAAIDPSLVSTVSCIESPKAPRIAEAVKRVKRKLHQMVGAYLDTRMPFDAWTARLRETSGGARLAVCREILNGHVSTRERLPELTGFFAAAFEGMPTPSSVADLACGLNPIARPFMPLPPGTLYRAFDVHLGLIAFVRAALSAMGFPAETGPWNLLSDRPPPSADVVLLLKTLPCLEQSGQAVSRRLLERIDASRVIVSFPTASLGGTRRGMERFYRERFLNVVPTHRFEIDSRTFRGELMFRLHRRSPAGGPSEMQSITGPNPLPPGRAALPLPPP